MAGGRAPNRKEYHLTPGNGVSAQTHQSHAVRRDQDQPGKCACPGDAVSDQQTTLPPEGRRRGELGLLERVGT